MLNSVGRSWLTPRRLAAIIILATVLLAAAWIAWRFAWRGPALAFVVPDGYTGYLVTRWECPGGEIVPRHFLGDYGNHMVYFAADGAACLADAIPRGGFRVVGFSYENGAPAPVIVGGTRALQGNLPPGQTEFVFSPLASLGIGNGRILGDECTLHDFLVERFGVPRRGFAGACDPIYTLPNAIPATPGLPAGPGQLSASRAGFGGR